MADTMLDPRRIDASKRIASLFLHPGCDMDCLFCASERGFSAMSQGEAIGLVEALAPGAIESVVLGGGEPLLWSGGAASLARRAKELGFLVQICTNGGAWPERLEELNGVDRFILPLEAADPAVHDRLRPHPGGHHATVLARVAELTEAGRELTVSTVVTRSNVDQLPALGELLERLREGGLRLHAWHLYRFLPLGRGGRPNADRLETDMETFLAACEEVKGTGLGFPVYRRDHMLRSTAVEYFWMENGRLCIGSEVLRERRPLSPPARPTPG